MCQVTKLYFINRSFKKYEITTLSDMELWGSNLQETFYFCYSLDVH